MLLGREKTALTVGLILRRVVRSLRGGVLPAAPEPVAFAVHFQDVDVVGEPVQQRAGEALRAEDFGPFVERQVGGHHDGTALVALAEDLEEQFPPVWDRGTKPSSSMLSSLSWESWRCRFSSLLSSLASISSWTSPAAVVKPTDMPRWQAARPY